MINEPISKMRPLNQKMGEIDALYLSCPLKIYQSCNITDFLNETKILHLLFEEIHENIKKEYKKPYLKLELLNNQMMSVKKYVDCIHSVIKKVKKRKN